ncbi:MAG TPA: STAS domain-containing protein [Acidimicrobiia bacterium]|nr:STAS domain-containing protein [Acidimicrobiia bacterium]
MSEFTILRLDDGSGLKVIGELDAATAPQLTTALSGASLEGEVVLDLSELTFLDSSGVRVIVELAATRNGNGPVVISNASPAVVRVFEILGLNQHRGIELRRATKQAPR